MEDFYGEQDAPAVGTVVRQPDTVTMRADPLKLDLDDSDLIKVIDDRIEQSSTFYEKELDLIKRRERNRAYLEGKQIDEDKLKKYHTRYIDNLIYEGENTIKPIALSRLPDLFVKPSQDSEESKETAKDLTAVINSDVRKRENRKVLGLAFKHHPVYLTGVMKAIWDPQRGDDGDYRFKVVHPDNVVMDHTSATNDPNDMDFVAEATEMSAKEVIMRFPDKEEEFLNAVKKVKRGFDEDKEKDMASKVKIWEVWFTWWDTKADEETGEKKWERLEGVIWKYDKVLLGKMKNPYWDWEGKPRLFKYELGKKRELTEDEVRSAVFGEQEGVVEDVLFYNFFKDPQKPYFFMGYDQLGEYPIDYTSRIEQVILLQDNVNKRGKQISEMNDRAKGKHVFSTESGLDKPMLEEMDMDNPDEDILVDGDVGNVHTFIPGTPAPAQLYQDQFLERQKVFSKLGVHSTTRGEREPGPQETATGRQLMRESDFGRIDDIVTETINPAAEWMASWAMQFIKMFYTKTHLRKLVGQDGDVIFAKIKRDTIEDGMEVTVSASGVDKLERKREAYERARMQLTDPLTFFVDTDASDPIGRTEKLMTFLTAPELYIQQFVKKRTPEEMGQVLQQQPITAATPPPTTEQAAQMFGGQGGGGWPPVGFGGDRRGGGV